MLADEFWPRVRFGDLLPDGTRNGIYKPKEFHGRGLKIVNMGELFANPRLHAINMKRVELTPDEVSRSTLQVGDLLFARRSLVAEGAGKCALVCEIEEPTTFESSIIRARPDRTRAHSVYLFYLFNSPVGRYLLGTILRHVAVAGITGSDLVELPLPLPPLAEQRAIAAVLGALDEKIELNRRINETLEELARAVFKSWFVHFEPVEAKANGRQPFGIHTGVAALFPKDFDTSELGEVPSGWKPGTLGDIARNPRSGAAPSELATDTPYIGLEHMPRRSIALEDWATVANVSSGKTHFKVGDFLFGKLRPYFHKVGIAPVNGVCSTDILVITPIENEYRSVVLGHISSDALIGYTDLGEGTKMPRTNWERISSWKLAIPPAPVAEAHARIIDPMLARIRTLILENHSLAELRDYLLPKLVAGEVRIRDAEKLVEAAT